MSRSDEDVLRFVAASLPSVWALELLFALKSDRRVWTYAELVATLRASELVVSKALDALVAGGFVSLEGEGAMYLPVNADVDECIERVERLYRSRPNSVRRAIVSGASSSATAFADAFRLRRESDD